MQHVDLDARLGGGREGALGTLARCAEASHGTLVTADLSTIHVFEVLPLSNSTDQRTPQRLSNTRRDGVTICHPKRMWDH